jgi:hypothetical protein
MYNDRDLYARAMQPHKELLHHINQEREVQQALGIQDRPPYQRRLISMLSDGLVAAGARMRPQSRAQIGTQSRKRGSTNYRMRRSA